MPTSNPQPPLEPPWYPAEDCPYCGADPRQIETLELPQRAVVLYLCNGCGKTWERRT